MIVTFTRNCSASENHCGAVFFYNRLYKVTRLTLCDPNKCAGLKDSPDLFGLLLVDTETNYSNHITTYVFRQFLKEGTIKVVTNLKEQ
jgi:hypothetical protein